MKMSFVKKLFAMVLALMVLVPSALAVQYVTFEDIPGDWNNYESAIKWMNVKYVPTSEHVWIDTDFLQGGEVAPGVFEFLADPEYAYENPDVYCAYLYIDTPGDALYVNAFEGNWATKEYMFMNCIGTDGMYADVFFPSFDRDGKLLTTDRVYLYEYQVDDMWYYGCVTFYFRYDGEETRSFLPKVDKVGSVKEAENTPVPEVPVIEEEPEVVPEVTETPATYVEVTEEETVTVTDDEASSIGIIGGDDGPTTVVVSGAEGFNGFFGNVFSGILSGIEEEVISTETVPAETTELTVPAPEDYIVETETYEEVTDVIEDETTGEPAAPGGILDFFSGVFGGFGN